MAAAASAPSSAAAAAAAPATSGAAAGSAGGLEARDVRIDVDELVTNRVQIAAADMQEVPVRELTAGEKFYVNVADVFAWQSKQQAAAAAAAAASGSAAASASASDGGAADAKSAPAAAAAAAAPAPAAPAAWPFASVEQRLNMARFQIDNIARVTDWLIKNHPLTLRQADVVQAQAVALPSAAASSASAGAPGGAAGSAPSAHDVARRKVTRFATVAMTKKQQLEHSASILSAGSASLRSSLAATKNFVADLKNLRSFWKVHHANAGTPQAMAALASSSTGNALDAAIVVDFAIPNLDDGVPSGHSGRALIRRDPSDGHIRLDGVSELLAEGGDALTTDASGATSGWGVCWQQLKRAQQLLLNKQLHAHLRKEANLLSISAGTAVGPGPDAAVAADEDDGAAGRNAGASRGASALAVATAAAAADASAPITVTVLDTALVCEHAPYAPVTFSFPRGGVDGFVVTGDEITPLHSALLWQSAQRMFLRRRHQPLAPTSTEKSVLGKAAVRGSARRGAGAAGLTGADAVLAALAIGTGSSASAPGSAVDGASSAAAVWLLPRLLRAANFHRLHARVKLQIDSFVAAHNRDAASHRPPLPLLSVELPAPAVPLARTLTVFAHTAAPAAPAPAPRLVLDATVVGTELTVVLPTASSPTAVGPAAFHGSCRDASHLTDLLHAAVANLSPRAAT